MTWYKNPVFLSVAVATVSAAITAITPYASSYWWVGGAVAFGGMFVSWLKEEETPTVLMTNPSVTSINTSTTGILGQSVGLPAPVPQPLTTVPYNPNDVHIPMFTTTWDNNGVQTGIQFYAPIGTGNAVNGRYYFIGISYNGAVSRHGNAVPNGAIYIGDGTFFLNGNTWN